MNLESVGEVIAERRLVLLHEQGPTEIIILLGKPQVLPPLEFQKSTSYFCPCQIIGLGDETVKCIGGVDGVQAIELAMKMIEAHLYQALRNRPGTRLVWRTEEPYDAQFPYPDRDPA